MTSFLISFFQPEIFFVQPWDFVNITVCLQMLSMYDAIMGSFLRACMLLYIFVFCFHTKIILLIKRIIITLISYKDAYLTAFQPYFLLNQLSLPSFEYLDMYVDLLVKFRYCEKATKFEKNSLFFSKFLCSSQNICPLSNVQCFLSIYCLVMVLQKYINRYANRCTVN